MPTLTVSRKVAGDKADSNEVLNQSAVFVTSAGYKATYAYEKLIDTLCHMVADKNNNDAFILGGTGKFRLLKDYNLLTSFKPKKWIILWMKQALIVNIIVFGQEAWKALSLM